MPALPRNAPHRDVNVMAAGDRPGGLSYFLIWDSRTWTRLSSSASFSAKGPCKADDPVIMRCRARRARSETLRAPWFWYCVLRPSYSALERRRLIVLILRSESGILGGLQGKVGQITGGQRRGVYVRKWARCGGPCHRRWGGPIRGRFRRRRSV